MGRGTSETYPFTTRPVDGRSRPDGRCAALVYECVCGEMVAPADIEAKTEVIECKKRGCKTRYVSTLSLLSREQNIYLLLNDSFTFIVPTQSLTIWSTTGSARGVGKMKDLKNDATEWIAHWKPRSNYHIRK